MKFQIEFGGHELKPILRPNYENSSNFKKTIECTIWCSEGNLVIRNSKYASGTFEVREISLREIWKFANPISNLVDKYVLDQSVIPSYIQFIQDQFEFHQIARNGEFTQLRYEKIKNNGLIITILAFQLQIVVEVVNR